MSKTKSESCTRVSTGIIIAILIIAVLLFSHIPAVMAGVVVIFNLLAVYEIFQAAHMLSEQKSLWAMLTASVLISLLPIPEYGKVLTFVFPLSSLVFAHIMRRCGRCILDVPVRICGICILVILLFKAIPSVRNLEHGFFLPAVCSAVRLRYRYFRLLNRKILGKAQTLSRDQSE